MLKISQAAPVQHTVTLRLEGRLAGPWVAQLRQSCETALAQARSLQLNLAEVDYLDANGVTLITSLRSRGVVLMECSPFVTEQLKAAIAAV